MELASTRISSLGLYIHVPFCRVRCPFCPFYVRIHRPREVRQYIQALKKELCMYAEMRVFHGIPVKSVYIGGGTPTTLSCSELGELLRGIRGGFSLSRDVEISVEAHPETLTAQDMKSLRAAGFTRLSLGVQSYDGDELNRLGGRIIGEKENVSVSEARDAGFENINLDLMYGFPGHTLLNWQHTLEKAVAFLPEHLSCYAFTVEEGTALHTEVSRGNVSMPDDELQVTFGEEAVVRLTEWGYDRYEVSNFSQAGYACRHNLRYWQGQDYLGLGPSAQSYLGGVRFGNIPNLRVYCESLQKAELPIETWESVAQCSEEREQVVFGLRLLKGVPVNRLSAALRSDNDWNRNIETMKQNGLVTLEEGNLRLTKLGILYADTVAVALL